MSQSQDIHSIIVQIFDDEYNILPSDGGAAEVQRVANYVDQKMKEIASQSNLPKAKVAVLAAMDITAELLRATAERDMLTEKAHQSLDRLNKLVEERADISEPLPQRPERDPQPLERLLRAQSARQRDRSSV